MRIRHLASFTTASLLLVGGCGGSTGGQQGEVAEMLLESAAADGIELDEDCVRDTAKGLSDADAAAIVEAGIDGDPDVSPDADVVAEEMFNCLDTDAMVDMLIEELGGEEGVDADCLRNALSGIGPADLESDETAMAMLGCIELGG